MLFLRLSTCKKWSFWQRFSVESSSCLLWFCVTALCHLLKNTSTNEKQKKQNQPVICSYTFSRPSAGDMNLLWILTGSFCLRVFTRLWLARVITLCLVLRRSIENRSIDLWYKISLARKHVLFPASHTVQITLLRNVIGHPSTDLVFVFIIVIIIF